MPESASTEQQPTARELAAQIQLGALKLRSFVLEKELKAQQEVTAMAEDVKARITITHGPDVDPVVRYAAVPLFKRMSSPKANPGDFIAECPAALPPDGDPASPPLPLTPSQRRLINSLTAHPTAHTVEEVCVLANVHPSSYYRWIQEPTFRACLTRVWVQNLICDGFELINIARHRKSKSKFHFKMLYNLLYTKPGMEALKAWQNAVHAGGSLPLADEESNPGPGPSLVAREFRKAAASPAAPATTQPRQDQPAPENEVAAPIQPDQSVTARNERKPPVSTPPPPPPDLPPLTSTAGGQI